MEMGATKKLNPVQWLVRYLRESKEELKKVSWPSKETTVKYSTVVIVVSLLIGLFIAGLDWILNLGLEELIIIIS